MSVYKILGVLSAVVFIAAYIPYILSIFKKQTTPHPLSWLLWALIGIVSLYFYILVGAKETLPFAIAGAIFPVMIVFISFKHWRGGFSLFDYACLTFSLLAVLAYLIFHVAAVSLSLSLVADVFAFLPTMRKTYIDPSSESLSSWMLFFSSYILSLIATIPHFTYGVVVFPAYLTVCGAVMLALILRGTIVKN